MKFKAGKYYVGDPCYVIRDDEWKELLAHSDFFNCGYYQWKGHRMFTASTAHGDGCFMDNEGREYGVDAGVIGIVPYDYIIMCDCPDCINGVEGGHVIEFKEDFEVCMLDRGVFCFGHIVIDSAGEEFCNDCGAHVDQCDCYCLECGNYYEECQCDLGEEEL